MKCHVVCYIYMWSMRMSTCTHDVKGGQHKAFTFVYAENKICFVKQIWQRIFFGGYFWGKVFPKNLPGKNKAVIFVPKRPCSFLCNQHKTKTVWVVRKKNKLTLTRYVGISEVCSARVHAEYILISKLYVVIKNIHTYNIYIYMS